MQKYVNPFTDFGFKKLFGEEPNKDLLLDFINSVLNKETGKIIDLKYLKTEHLGYTYSDRRAVFDVYCENEKGEKFIVEVQKTKQRFFKDRALYYATLPIKEQAKKGFWDYELKAVYIIAILDFIFDEEKKNNQRYKHEVMLCNVLTNEIFYDKLIFFYFEMPKFNKSIDELETRYEKWLYLLKNLPFLDRLPEQLREKLFEKLFETAEIARFTPEQIEKYEDDIKVVSDIQNSLNTAREDGKMEEKLEIAKRAIKIGLSLSEISNITGLDISEIEKLK